jgi:uncharacterized protein (DUF2235 family)
MARQLVVFLDGTGNRFSHRPTNVLHILRSLKHDPAQVLTYYDQGVGTFGLKETLFEWEKVPSRVFGLAFGWGLERIIAGAYQFLAGNYEDGDEIYIFGFSRGAYAARALAALVRAVGLLPVHQVNLFDYAWAMLLSRDRQSNKPDFHLQAEFKSTFGRPIRIRFLGLFDTVKSVGWIYDPVSIPYTTNNNIVDFVRHAVSIDERRCFFRQNLWSPEHSDKTDLKEVWFAGVHSDIGGGYPPEEARLARVARRWMMGEALSSGLNFDPNRSIEELGPAGEVADDCIAAMHDSMTGAWNFAEWAPRLVWSGADEKRHLQIGAMPPFGSPNPRFIPENAFIHRSVEQRLRRMADYRPPNLPNSPTFVDDTPFPLE